jgi:enediyne core biosynthesis thioesterase
MNVNTAPADIATAGLAPRPAFIYRHIVSFEETNVVGNVYFTRHLCWQGRCREMFLRENAPGILQEIARDLRLVTLRVSCEYFDELNAFDEIDVQMRLAYLRESRIGLNFNIVKLQPAGNVCSARGFQEIASMRATANGLVPIHPPSALLEALRPFQDRKHQGQTAAGDDLVRHRDSH